MEEERGGGQVTGSVVATASLHTNLQVSSPHLLHNPNFDFVRGRAITPAPFADQNQIRSDKIANVDSRSTVTACDCSGTFELTWQSVHGQNTESVGDRKQDRALAGVVLLREAGTSTVRGSLSLEVWMKTMWRCKGLLRRA